MEHILHEIGIHAIVNFLVFATLITLALRKPVKEMLRDRHSKLREDIETTRVQLADAQKKFQEYTRRIQTLDQEVATIIQSAREEAETSKVRIITEAKRMADNIIIDAKRGAEGLMSEYKDQVRTELAGLVVTRAEQIIRQKLSEDDRERLKKDFSRQVEGAR